MNEIIAKLAEQAAQESALLKNQSNLEVKVNDVKSYQVPATFIEKFAELIVRECSDVGRQYADGNYEVPERILGRFGLEE